MPSPSCPRATEGDPQHQEVRPVKRIQRFLPLICIFISSLFVNSTAAFSDGFGGVHRVGAYLSQQVQPGPLAERVFLALTPSDERRLLDLRKQLIERGARKVNCFLPSLIVFETDSRAEFQDILADPSIRLIEEGNIVEEWATGGGLTPGSVKGCYQMLSRAVRGGGETSSSTAFRDTVLLVPREVVEGTQARVSETDEFGAPLSDRNVHQNSEFLVGDVLVQLIYPESNEGIGGEQEDWSDRELGEAVSGAIGAMLAFQERFHQVPIHYVFRTYERAPTQYEPIAYNMTTDSVWIADVMRKLGYGRRTYLYQVHDFNNYWRNYYGTDWAFTAFVANSEKEPGNRFRGAWYTAYAYLGGPFLVMPYPAGDNNPANIDPVLMYSQIFQHESCHIFWALDEYPEALGACNERSGYLNVVNMNKSFYVGEVIMSCQEVPIPCIMDRAARQDLGRPVCVYTAGQMGLTLTDDGIPKVFDSTPIIEFENARPETVDTGEITIRSKATSTPVPNKNPKQQSEENRISYAAPLRDAWYSMDDVGRIKMLPIDGKWDELEEDLVLRILSLPVGLVRVSMRVKNSVGKWSQVYTKSVYNVGLKFANFKFRLLEEGIHFTWDVVGETFEAAFDLHKVDPRKEPRDQIIVESIQPSDTSNSEFHVFSYFDRDVIPGERYGYYIEGTFTIDMHGEKKTYVSHSPTCEAVAMLPIVKGSVLSHPSPNPFDPSNDKVKISIDVPRSFTSTGSGMYSEDAHSATGGPAMGIMDIPTRVDVTIYDVLGRLVKKLHSDESYAGVLTVEWDGTNGRGETAPTGIYFLRAQVGSITQVRKLLLLR